MDSGGEEAFDGGYWDEVEAGIIGGQTTVELGTLAEDGAPDMLPEDAYDDNDETTEEAPYTDDADHTQEKQPPPFIFPAKVVRVYKMSLDEVGSYEDRNAAHITEPPITEDNNPTGRHGT